jgi:hypothetical protein
MLEFWVTPSHEVSRNDGDATAVCCARDGFKNGQRQIRGIGWDAALVEKRISLLRRQEAPPPVEMTKLSGRRMQSAE